MKAEWLASASLAIAGVCLGLNMSQPVYDPQDEQFKDNPSKGMGFVLGAGMVISGAVMAKRSTNEPEPVRKVQPKVVQSQPAVAPIAYNPQPQIVENLEPAEYTPDAEFDIPLAQPVASKNSLQTAIDYTLNRTGAGIILSSLTGSGKTTFLYAYLAEILQRTNGAAHISVIDCKGSLWAGLENLKERDGSDRVVVVGDKSEEEEEQAIEDAIAKIKFFATLRAERAAQRMKAERENKAYNPAPAILLIEEWVAFIGSLSDKVKKAITKIVNNLFLLGREDGVFVMLTGQSHRCNVLEISAGVRDNVLLLGLNAVTDLRSIRPMISDPWVVCSQGERDELAHRLSHLVAQCDRVSYCSYGHILEPMPMLDKRGCYEQLKRFFSNNVVAFSRPKAEPQKDELLTDYWA